MSIAFAVLGGDRRQLELARQLRRDGHPAALYGFDQVEGETHSSLAEALEASCVVLPMPVTKDGESLFAPFGRETLLLEDLWPRLNREQVLCGGTVGELLRRQTEARGLFLEDYAAREELQVANAVPTVEGALAAAMERTAATIHGSQCLVIGYGRIGQLLAHRLQGLGASVSVAARQYAHLAWIRAYGWRALRSDRLEGEPLGNFDVIFNTVPAPMLARGELERLKPGCVVIDLASAPGGVDFAAAGDLGIDACWARFLPGKVAPVTAAQAIRDAVYHILEERGEPI